VQRIKVYLAGPMTGLPDFNFPEFARYAAALRNLGYGVVSPAEMDGGDVFQEKHFYMRRDLRALLDCDGIVMIPGWQRSRGALIELLVANAAGLKLLVWSDGDQDVVSLEIPRQMVVHLLDDEGAIPYEEGVAQAPAKWGWAPKASDLGHALVTGARQSDYGHPINDFTRTGRMWGAILGIPDVPPEKVGLCMVALKLSRESHKHLEDNLVDGHGYLNTVEMIEREYEEMS